MTRSLELLWQLGEEGKWECYSRDIKTQLDEKSFERDGQSRTDVLNITEYRH